MWQITFDLMCCGEPGSLYLLLVSYLIPPCCNTGDPVMLSPISPHLFLRIVEGLTCQSRVQWWDLWLVKTSQIEHADGDRTFMNPGCVIGLPLASSQLSTEGFHFLKICDHVRFKSEDAVSYNWSDTSFSPHWLIRTSHRHLSHFADALIQSDSQ